MDDNSYSAKAFLKALSCFISRKRLCKTIYWNNEFDFVETNSKQKSMNGMHFAIFERIKFVQLSDEVVLIKFKEK